MLPADIHLTFEDGEAQNIEVTHVATPEIVVVGSGTMGPQGPQGPEGQWVSMTQAEYDALTVHDPNTLYVIVL